MSIAFVAENFHTHASLTLPEDTTTSDFGFSPNPAPGAGHQLVLFWSAKVSSGTNVKTSCSVTDSKGNTWTILAKEVSGTHWALIATTDQAAGTLTTSDVVTVHTGTAAVITALTARIEEFASVAASPVDVFATSTGTSTAPATGATAATAQDDEVVLALLTTASNQGVTKDAAYLAFPSGGMTVTSPTLASVSAYKLTAGLGTGAQSATGSMASSAAWIGLVATLKGTGVAPPANQIRFNGGLVVSYDLAADGSPTNLQVVTPATPASPETPHPDYPAHTGYQLALGPTTYQFDIDAGGLITNFRAI